MLIKTPVRYNERSGYIMDADGNYIASPMLMSAHEDTVVQQRREAAEQIVTALNENAALRQENERYRQALEHYANSDMWARSNPDESNNEDWWLGIAENGYDIAHEALHPKQEEQDADIHL